uniref:Uncharacterized protein n=1 Tax=Anguilla anguilla TaxID=7936 RepID=A0A0E9PRY6_ANGAN
MLKTLDEERRRREEEHYEENEESKHADHPKINRPVSAVEDTVCGWVH